MATEEPQMRKLSLIALASTLVLALASRSQAGTMVPNPHPIPPGTLKVLNPQPIPPGKLKALNPQPIPPGKPPEAPQQEQA
jgi:hypothetical protein